MASATRAQGRPGHAEPPLSQSRSSTHSLVLTLRATYPDSVSFAGKLESLEPSGSGQFPPTARAMGIPLFRVLCVDMILESTVSVWR